MKSTQSFTVQWLTQLEVQLANKFYRKYHFRGKAKRNESCVVVKNARREIISCGYLRNYKTFNLLAGVAVAPHNQGKGVARLLLDNVSARFTPMTYTFPYEYLIPLYQSFGFKIVSIEQTDPQVVNLYTRYRVQGRSISLMRFQ